ncbi:TonB-dependent receptor [Hymenobacter lutimineralis]|uniref:TonB-dependent receptor n=1 Tax=Hymenobacter lutimineralis TaxID=2606448 RepID=A0A5D6V5J0_9BACT|nr:outer membrane beta-barrel family protein [Hymenobacter lutimineralis]TYZ10570.1 TonB-dependent receptor [Hymenobacter lutimineralis]
MKTQLPLYRTLRGLGLLFMFFPLAAAAQQEPTGSVGGTLLDQSNKQPVPFANVVVLRAQDSTFVAGAETGENGTFRLASLGLGKYLVKTSAIGYQPLRRSLTLTTAAPDVQLGSFSLTPIATQLKGVTVTGQKETVQNDLGKRVINVEKDLSSVGGTAVNVLQNVPSVAVDANGTVSLRGSSNLTILIDGKPAGTSNGGPGPRLDQLPASRISQVEVMTNPSAKYDASGAGVINIITKKDKKEGTNGQIGLVAGNGRKYAPTLSLSRRRGKATWNFGYNGRDQRFTDKSKGAQTAYLENGDVIQTTQQGTGIERRINHSLNLGIDYELSEEQSLSFSVSPSKEGEKNFNTQTLTTKLNGEAKPDQLGQQKVDVDVRVWNADASYRRTWAQQKGRELTSNAGYVVIDADVPFTQQLSNAPTQRQQFAVAARILYGTLDYTHPLAGDKGKIETGLKLQMTDNDGTADLSSAPVDRPTDFQPDAARSVAYDIREVLPAAYVTYQRTLGHNYSLQSGLRAEYTNLSGTVKGGSGRVGLDYLSLFPSATLAKELGKEPGQQRLQLSYARRIDRPNFMEQLPFQLYQDARTYRQGNPGLRAEFSHNVELGHQLNLSGGASITGTLFGRFSQNVVQRVREIDTAATRINQAGIVTAETYRNFGNTTNLGAEATWNQSLTKWWRVSASGSLYRSEVASNGQQGNNRRTVAGTMRFSTNFTPRPTLDVQLTGSWRSATLTAQGRQLAYGGLEVALRQRMFQDRAALTLRVSDIFDTQVSRSEINTEDLTVRNRYKNETRVGWLGFTWYIGATKPPKKIESQPQGGGGGFGG